VAEDAKIGSPAFQEADKFVVAREGGYTEDDVGAPANYGINQAAHPELDVKTLTPQGAQRIRYEYWRAVGGDEIAQNNPQLATAVYDTAVMTGPNRAKQLLAQSGGDASAFLQLRTSYLNDLVRKNPEKYGSVAPGWTERTNMLAQQTGSAPVSEQTSQVQPEQATARPLAVDLTHALQAAAPKAPGANIPAQHPLSPQQVPHLAAPSRIDLYNALLSLVSKPDAPQAPPEGQFNLSPPKVWAGKQKLFEEKDE
jgi:lysozyme family protein